MYGTIARLQVKPGSAEELAALTSSHEDVEVPGFIATYAYRSDRDPDEIWLAVLFEDRESYHRNAADPAQDARYRTMRELLAADPEWHDGEVMADPQRRATRSVGSGGAGGGY